MWSCFVLWAMDIKSCHSQYTCCSATTECPGENGAYSQELMDAAQDKAQEILDAWEAGEATEDSFAALAEEKTMDPGSKSNGGLYENVVLGQMVKPFEDWCFDADRIYGDTGLVQTDYGVHVMFFVSASEEENWFVQTKNLMTDQETQKSMAEIVQNHSVEVDYRNLYIASIPAPGEE